MFTILLVHIIEKTPYVCIPPAARGRLVRAALPERATAGPLLHGRGPGRHRQAVGRGGAGQDGGGGAQ